MGNLDLRTSKKGWQAAAEGSDFPHIVNAGVRGAGIQVRPSEAVHPTLLSWRIAIYGRFVAQMFLDG